jgi:hypothetical protein
LHADVQVASALANDFGSHMDGQGADDHIAGGEPNFIQMEKCSGHIVTVTFKPFKRAGMS